MAQKTNSNLKNKEKAIKNANKTYTDPVTGKFVKGNPGGGRPVGSRSKSTIFTEALEKLVDEIIEGDGRTYAEAMVKRIMLNAIQGKEKSAEMLWDRLEGKPTQPIDHKIGSIEKKLTEKEREFVMKAEEDLKKLLINPEE